MLKRGGTFSFTWKRAEKINFECVCLIDELRATDVVDLVRAFLLLCVPPQCRRGFKF